jgi:hypothetical protein
MSAGTPVALNTFWRRRMAMLPKLVRLNSSMSGQNRGILALFGLSLLLVPTWCQQAQSQFGGLGGKTNQVAEEKPADKTLSTPTTESDKVKPKEKSVDPIPPVDNSIPPAPNAGFVPKILDVRKAVSGVTRPKLPQSASPVAEYFPELTETDKRIADVLDEQVDLHLDGESIESALETARSKHPGLQFILDRIALNEASIAADTPDITLHVSGISLRSWLKILLDPKDLTFFLEDEVIKVTTKSVAREKTICRTYPVRDLASNVDVDYLLLKDAIQQATKNHSWIDLEGEGGTISILPASGCLVISTSWQGHNEVLKLLRAIRQANKE